MLFDKVRFITEKMIEYGKFKLYFGSINNSIVKKWYLLNEHNELYEMKEFDSVRIKSYRVPSCTEIAGKHFYKKKMKNLQVEKKSVISVLVKSSL